MKIVNDWGTLVKMSDRNYQRYLEAGTDGKQPEPSEYGKVIGHIDFTAIDAKVHDFTEYLDIYLRNKNSK